MPAGFALTTFDKNRIIRRAINDLLVILLKDFLVENVEAVDGDDIDDSDDKIGNLMLENVAPEKKRIIC